jgi:hypothetical protein
MSKRSVATTIAVLGASIAVIGLSSQAFAQSSGSCSDQIAYLREQGPKTTAPGE